jgi:hypothetical protein
LLVRALWWPNPLVWWASQRLAVESERACDDLVLGSGTRPSQYAEHLLEAARALRLTPGKGRQPASVLGMASASQLAGRIASILDHDRCRTPMDRGRVLVTLALAVVIAIPVAAAAPVAPAPPAPPEARAPGPDPPLPTEQPHPVASPPPALPPVPAAVLPTEDVPVPEPVPVTEPAPGAEHVPVTRPLSMQPLQAPPRMSIPLSLVPLDVPAGTVDLPSASELSAPAPARSTSPGVLGDRKTSPPSPGAAPDRTLVASPKGWLSPDFILQRNGSSTAELTANRWKPEARLEIGEGVFDLYREGRLSGEFVLARGDSIIARAKKPTFLRSTYSVQWADATYTLQPRSITKSAFVLIDGDRELGAVERESWHSRRAQLVFPGDWPLEIQVFAFWLSELSWQDDEDQNAMLRGVTAAAIGP